VQLHQLIDDCIVVGWQRRTDRLIGKGINAVMAIGEPWRREQAAQG
jgi:hypothetical protein